MRVYLESLQFIGMLLLSRCLMAIATGGQGVCSKVALVERDPLHVGTGQSGLKYLGIEINTTGLTCAARV